MLSEVSRATSPVLPKRFVSAQSLTPELIPVKMNSYKVRYVWLAPTDLVAVARSCSCVASVRTLLGSLTSEHVRLGRYFEQAQSSSGLNGPRAATNLRLPLLRALTARLPRSWRCCFPTLCARGARTQVQCTRRCKHVGFVRCVLGDRLKQTRGCARSVWPLAHPTPAVAL